MLIKPLHSPALLLRLRSDRRDTQKEERRAVSALKDRTWPAFVPIMTNALSATQLRVQIDSEAVFHGRSDQKARSSRLDGDDGHERGREIERGRSRSPMC